MKTYSEPRPRPCTGCPLLRNTIKGHWCTRLRIVTEYAKTKPCNTNPQTPHQS